MITKFFPHLLRLALLIVLLAIGFILMQNFSQPRHHQPVVTATLPEDFKLHFEWGVCREHASRIVLDVNHDAKLDILRLNADQQTGREHTAALTAAQIKQLLATLDSNQVMSLPTMIQSPPNVTALDAGCSNFALTMNNHSISIQEADGINSNYYHIKKYLQTYANLP